MLFVSNGFFSPSTNSVITSADGIDGLNVSDTSDDEIEAAGRPQIIANDINMDDLTTEQLGAVKCILKSMAEHVGELFVLDSPAGHGKSHVIKAIKQMADEKRRKCVTDDFAMRYNVVICATTGAAATILPDARTVHTTFKLPLSEITSTTVLTISRQSILGKTLRDGRLIVIDEASMLTRHQLDAIDRSLRVSVLICAA